MMDFNFDPSNFKLPENLRALRKLKKWSQEELAEKLGLNRGNIASYESGTAEPKICNLVKFARLFNLSISDLTHSDLTTEDNYIQATRRYSNGNGLPPIDHYANQAKEYESAIKGLESIFNMKIREIGELPDNMKFLKNQFEQLSSISQHLLNNHFELIATVKSHCREQPHSSSPARQQK
ncbi:MAG TPA: helix-turn-helix domain-containing protein [Bacteroidetes bacterium]|nr:helix-turn-helix domain-containing protein [Bacteroidota bacterium]